MKLYTEEQVKQMIEKSQDTGLTAEYLILTRPPIELPSDEEIVDEVSTLTFSSEKYKAGVIEGMQWMRDKIQGGNK